MIEQLYTGSQAIAASHYFLPDNMNSRQAYQLLMTIGLQESAFKYRWQIVNWAHPDRMGPARGFWMFERGGGATGVITHPASRPHAIAVCQAFREPATAAGIYDVLHLPTSDPFAAAMARLLLWTDPQPLPTVDDTQRAWDYYIRVWRPGAFTRGTALQRKQLQDKFNQYHAQVRSYLEH